MVSHIPLYVYVLFYFLLYWGYKSCFPRIMRIERLMLLPLIFIILSIRTALNLLHMGLTGMGFWILGGTLGVFIGYLHVRNRTIRADQKQKLISVPGDWTMLVLIIFIFAFEFFVHYCMEAGWPMSQLDSFKLTAECVLGMIAGMAVGRNLTTTYKYTKAPSENLLVTAYVGKT